MEGLGKLRDEPPTHFLLKIESFSTLLASSMQRYETPEFEAAGAKWKLAIYPNGNKARGGKDHISLYLVLADRSSLNVNKEILVTFRLFMFDSLRNKYLTDEQVIRFNEVTYEHGFDKFLPLEVLKDNTNGYLINDTCFFGAEVFLIKATNKLNCLSMVRMKSEPSRFTWKIDQFSKMDDKEYFSENFTACGYEWKLSFYPKGNKEGKGNSISLYLFLVDSETSKFQEEKQVIVEYKLCIVDQLNKRDFEAKAAGYLSSSGSKWGWSRFLSFTNLKNKSYGLLVKDSVILEADVLVLGSATDCV